MSSQQTDAALQYASDEIDRLRRKFAELEDVLEEIKEYLADREDADHDGERFIPNKEMSLLIALRRAMGEDL